MEGGSLNSAANMKVSKTVSIGNSWSSCITSFKASLSNPTSQSIKKSGFTSTTRPHDGHDFTPCSLARDIIEKIGLFFDPNPIFLLLLPDTIRQVLELKSLPWNQLPGRNLQSRRPLCSQSGFVHVHHSLQASVVVCPDECSHGACEAVAAVLGLVLCHPRL